MIKNILAEQQLELCALIRPVANAMIKGGGVLARAWFSIEQATVSRPKAASPGFPALADQELPLFGATDSDALAALDLDVILDFSDQYGLACDRKLARHGVWFLGFPVNDPAMAGLAELVSREPAARIALFRRVSGEEVPLGIEEGLLNLKFAASRTGQFMLEMAIPLLLRELRWTYRVGQPRHSGSLAFQVRNAPDLVQTLRYIPTFFSRLAKKLLDEVSARARLRPNMFHLISATSGLLEFNPKSADSIISENNSLYADPFLWERDGECFCFFEEYDYRADRGHISVGRFENNQLIEIRPVLKRDYHLSFPFLFEDEGTLFMMPESFNANRLEVWKCVSFPDQWELYATAFEGCWAADSTLSKIGDSWWLFSNIATDAFLDTSTALYIFQVDGPDLADPRPHACNPVIFNARQARNGGRIIEIGGDLFRISQDNSHGRYGYGLNIMKISRLSLTEYEEERVATHLPDFAEGIDGCHHLDIRGGRVVMDVRKKFGGFAGLVRWSARRPRLSFNPLSMVARTGRMACRRRPERRSGADQCQR
ncbi:hypothetical protein G6N82_02600 [Altererythrobacter sp. BO-6]|uniref:glucosamine inositolphosphorylceramide transferase family protein n=1 Tax=Altererythrobacter sp. BO-6 TaxID=2604537 RepID=UPI0013E1B72C|nr:hypothetical protein [Altererythrobacter sp. BO-6]QIG53189.1 hypothetical protein G6N82_02600 [Altererythrobacter sp. BO-6]